MRKLVHCLIAIAALGAAIGCSGTEATATKAEEGSFRNPSKTPPPGASAGGPPPANPGK